MSNGDICRLTALDPIGEPFEAVVKLDDSGRIVSFTAMHQITDGFYEVQELLGQRGIYSYQAGDWTRHSHIER